MGYKITIDGPAGAGKGFLATELANRLDLLYVDTGAMYRAIALYTIENNIDASNNEQVIDSLKDINIKLSYVDKKLKIYLNNSDVSVKIRTEQVALVAAKVSSIPEVREFMVNIQRNFAKNNNIVMEGRDIGSIVLPDAELKIFLTGSKEERAKRRMLDLINKGKVVTLEEVIDLINKRDELDRTREISPLIKTEDMIEIDTTNLDKDGVVKRALELVEEKGLI